MYQLLLYVHIVCAVIWVGGALYVQLLAILIGRSDDRTELPRLGQRAALIGSRVFMPVAAVLFITGAVMTYQAWSFGQTWIVLGIGLWVLSALAGAVYLAPRTRQAAALFAAEGPTSVAARRLVGRMFLVSRLELVSFALVIGLMVFKPGA